ncbi:MAG: retron St85 family RNA-directed DNA polymerase [Sulfurovum sp.]|nr:retron St85 family RNA-directed DNA polymerase [Sulfurovum sp.]MCB4762948.1 retron St85 family RNA-directed DNA polymerase [Sulfurovum sp.]MCB4773402.1 retron St85 family RNA-directed DNA polymerase [Sulfurovum sp.]MCB4782936.1 retron St85 family RNA-directed DNA polymerase [Sulfurovum sp.]
MNIFQEEISRHFEKSYRDIFQYASRASRRYKSYTIPKKTGGSRKIIQPSKELKEYQRYLIETIFNKLPVHDAVYSYREGRSIKQMAEKHIDARYLLRIDFKEFFPSIRGEHIREFLTSNIHHIELSISDYDLTLINLLVCKSNKLTIGAPSSPIISNTILYELDKFLFDTCHAENIIYTRYADDLYFSTMCPNKLQTLLPILKQYLKTFFIRLAINEDKNIYTSKKRKQQVTGLTLTTDKKISVGRKKKRYIRSLIHKYSQQNITGEEANYLKGYMSYLYSIEPDYIENLVRKYSKETIAELLPLKNNN